MRISDLSSDVCSSDLSVRIQPVHIDYGPATAEISWHSDEPAGANVKRLLERKGRLDLRLRFLEPFDPAICPDRKALAAMSRERIAASIAAHLPPFTCGARLLSLARMHLSNAQKTPSPFTVKSLGTT